MKKFWFALIMLISGMLLISGCNNSETGNDSSNTVPNSNESSVQTSSLSSPEPTGSAPENTSSSAVQSVSASSPESSIIPESSTNKPPVSSSFETTVSTSASIPESSSASSSAASSSNIQKPESSSAVSGSIKIPQQPAIKEENNLNILITVNGKTFPATLQDNETAKAFKAQLPLTLDMSELNGNEKYYYLSETLPTNSSVPDGINSGDIMLYGNSCLVIFYESFPTSYSYTPIGKIDDPGGLASALGRGNAKVTFNTIT